MQRVCSLILPLILANLGIRFGFVKYFSPASAENCIRGFFHLGYQASYAQVNQPRSAVFWLMN